MRARIVNSSGSLVQFMMATVSVLCKNSVALNPFFRTCFRQRSVAVFSHKPVNFHRENVRLIASSQYKEPSSETLPELDVQTKLTAPQYDHYRERFIPLTRHSTVALLLKDENVLTPAEKKDFERFALALDAVISMKYDASVQELKQLFDPVNPDKDTMYHQQLSTQSVRDSEFWLLQRLSQIMEKANFYEIPEAEMRRLLVEHETSEGVKVSIDVSKYDVLKFWMLGKETVKRNYSLAQRLWMFISRQQRKETLVNFKRVIAAVRLKKDDKLTLKAFKDVPSYDLEKLLPAGQIKMGTFDRYLILTSVTLTGIGLLGKFVTILAKVHVNWTLGFAAITGLLGLNGYLTYKSRKGSYLSKLNTTLYYKNIANNRGLISLVIDRAEDESFKEALLTYSFISSMAHGSSQGVNVIALENAIEEWISSNTGVPIEFDSADSVALLEQIGVLSKTGEGTSTCYNVLPLEAVLKLLPQTPLSILTRVYQSDVLEGYDRSRSFEASPNAVRSTSTPSRWMSSLPKLSQFPWIKKKDV